MQMISLFSPTTSAVISGAIAVEHGMAVTFVADGTLAVGEEIPIEVQTASGWVAVVEGGIPVALSVDDSIVATDKPGLYRASKPATVAAVGVTVYR